MMSKSQVTSSLRKVTRMILISTAIIFYIIYISRMGQTYISRLWKDYR